jgi:hypothetical protein
LALSLAHFSSLTPFASTAHSTNHLLPLSFLVSLVFAQASLSVLLLNLLV